MLKDDVIELQSMLPAEFYDMEQSVIESMTQVIYPLLEDLPDYTYLGFGTADCVAFILELLHKTFPRNPGVTNPIWNYFDAVASILVGIYQLLEVKNKKTHQPLLTATKGGLNIGSGVQLIALTALSPFLGMYGFAAAATAAFISSVFSSVNTIKRAWSFDYWLENSLAAWMQLEKNIVDIEAEIEALDKRLQPLKATLIQTKIEKTWLHYLYDMKKERLAGMRLDSFLLKKDITCAVALRVSNKEDVTSISAIIDQAIEKSQVSSEKVENADTELLVKETIINSVQVTLKELRNLTTITSEISSPARDSIVHQQPTSDPIQVKAKEIIGSMPETQELPKGEVFASRVKEAEKYGTGAEIDFEGECRKIEEKNRSDVKDTLKDSYIYGVAAVGMIMCCIPFLQVPGLCVVGAAAGLYAYKHREGIKNTSSFLLSYVGKSRFFKRANQEKQPLLQGDVAAQAT